MLGFVCEGRKDGPPAWTYNSSNQLTSRPGFTYTYDNNGNTLTKADTNGTTTYAWDLENRLTSVILPDQSQVTFKYDPFGRRIQKSSTAGTVNYAYDGANVVEEVDGAGVVLARYAQGAGIDEPLAESTGGATSFYAADGLGSITSLSSSGGALTDTYVRDAFGKSTTASGTTRNPYRYTAREFDSETGLYYYRARYYDGQLGRFLSEDPEPRDNNSSFVYVSNNPLLWVDPSGRVRCTYEVASHHYHCVSDDGTQTFDTTRVRSGNGNCMNNPNCANVRNRGPIPPGRYTMGRMGGTPRRHRVPRVALTATQDTNRQGRDTLQVHQGGNNDSEGCITIDPDEYQRFRRFYERDNHGTTEVR